MIRYIRCIRRQSHLTPAEFRRHWETSEYREVLERMAHHMEAESVLLSVTLRLEINAKLMDKQGSRNPYDGLIEFSWFLGGDFDALMSGAEWQALESELRVLEADFVEMSDSTDFFVTDD